MATGARKSSTVHVVGRQDIVNNSDILTAETPLSMHGYIDKTKIK